ncbi:MAG: hypothetical protein H0X26_00140 [Alphaproteobacteria bacterium]|nr:hypothetical protein [Alphaproteobacteria bacterium]
MKTKALFVALALITTQSAYSTTATDVFPGKEDWAVLKGEKVRKGTIAATINNIKRLDDLMTHTGSEAEIRDIIKDQNTLSRGLFLTDFLEMQPVINWLQDPKRPGKVLVAVLVLQASPELLTDQIRVRLQDFLQEGHPLLKDEIRKAL